MFEAVGNMHMHTPYSDGEKWHAEIAQEAIRAGLDFVIVTDHNVWVEGVEGYYQGEGGRALLMVGEEVHDVRRRPQANHFLAYGAEKELYHYAADPQRLIDETRAAGGLGFLAHPFDPQAGLLGDNGHSLGWQNWEVEGYTGLEIWNYMSNFKGLLDNKVQTIRAAMRPEQYIVGPEPGTIAKWDELLAQGKRIVAIGGSDAHGTRFKWGLLARVVFPYNFLFCAVNTHILIQEPLSGNLAQDKKRILEALGRGRAWVGYDMPHSTKGFRFTGQSLTKGVMGDEIKLDVGATLQVRTPAPCHIRLIWQGKVVAEIQNDTNLTHIPVEPGAYRVECTIPYLGRERSWIYSNPIYLC
ncbi:MAG: CehA/McbA family metallohydrolase [Chloroflexi bacterium]|nr:CehA/McbA family metallohydrolase [Chloroflexota bacterium]